MSMRRWTTIIVGLVVAVVVMAAGCGSGGSGPAALVGNPQGTGSLHFAVKFPPRPEVTPQSLPVATNSVRITVVITQTQAQFAQVVVPRPAPNGGDGTASTTIADVPMGDVQVNAEAFESGDGTGTVIATCGASTTVVAGQTATVAMIADPLVISGTAMPGTVEIVEGDTARVATQWFDADGNEMVPSSVVWSTNDDTVATVVPDLDPMGGEIAGVAAGTCDITAQATPAGSSAPAQVGLSQTSAVDNNIKDLVQPQQYLPNPEVTIAVTVINTGELVVIVE